MFAWSKVGVVLVIMMMSFLINIFYYMAWMLTDTWLMDTKIEVDEGGVSLLEKDQMDINK